MGEELAAEESPEADERDEAPEGEAEDVGESGAGDEEEGVSRAKSENSRRWRGRGRRIRSGADPPAAWS